MLYTSVYDNGQHHSSCNIVFTKRVDDLRDFLNNELKRSLNKWLKRQKAHKLLDQSFGTVTKLFISLFKDYILKDKQ